MSDDPERDRIFELTQRVRRGEADEAEREELALYTAQEPEVAALALRAERDGELGQGWLARNDADEALARAETTTWTKAERGVGVAMVVGGVFGAFVFPPAALGVLVGGALLTYSVLRVKLATAGKDPYADIEK